MSATEEDGEQTYRLCFNVRLTSPRNSIAYAVNLLHKCLAVHFCRIIEQDGTEIGISAGTRPFLGCEDYRVGTYKMFY